MSTTTNEHDVRPLTYPFETDYMRTWARDWVYDSYRQECWKLADIAAQVTEDEGQRKIVYDACMDVVPAKMEEFENETAERAARQMVRGMMANRSLWQRLKRWMGWH